MTEQPMPPTNLIQNGSFNGGNASWTGTDLETSYTETAYLSNGSTNRVAELDGFSNQTTVMQQSFVVTAPMVTEVTLDTALRNASLSRAGTEGYRIDVLDSTGTVIATQTVMPTTNSWVAVSVPVTFTQPGTYTLRLTELGPNDSLGAIIDNVSILTCFVSGTLIATPGGPRPVEALGPGDLVVTAEGPREVHWAGQTRVGLETLRADPRKRPVRIAAGALGPGLPSRDLYVSRQHRMLVANRIGARIAGAPLCWAKAAALAGLEGIAPHMPGGDIAYHHLLLDRHAVIFAHDAPTESFLLGPQSLVSLSEVQLVEIERRLPGAAAAGAPTCRPAYLTLSGKQVRLLRQRMMRHGVPLVDRAAVPWRGAHAA